MGEFKKTPWAISIDGDSFVPEPRSKAGGNFGGVHRLRPLRPSRHDLVIKFAAPGEGVTLAQAEASLEYEAMAYRAAQPHDNIARCYGLVEWQSRRGLVLERLAVDANQVIGGAGAANSSGRLSWSELVGVFQYYFKEVLSAIDHLQERAIVHHDIKPQNVMIDLEYRRFKLVDFGAMTMPGHGTGGGTKPYRPPEEIFKGCDDFPGNVSADVYAVGRHVQQLFTRLDIHSVQLRHDAMDRRREGGGAMRPFSADEREELARKGATDAADRDASAGDWRPSERFGPGGDAYNPTTVSPALHDKQTALVEFINGVADPDPRTRFSAKAALAHRFVSDRLLSDEEAQAIIRRLLRVAPPAPRVLVPKATNGAVKRSWVSASPTPAPQPAPAPPPAPAVAAQVPRRDPAADVPMRRMLLRPVAADDKHQRDAARIEVAHKGVPTWYCRTCKQVFQLKNGFCADCWDDKNVEPR
jgi:hypothetical protein